MKKLNIFIYAMVMFLIFSTNINASSLKCVYGHLIVTYNTDNYKFTAKSDNSYVEYQHRLNSTNFTTSNGKLMCLEELYVVSYSTNSNRITTFNLSVYKKDAQIVNGKPYSIALDEKNSYVDNGDQGGSSSGGGGNSSGGQGGSGSGSGGYPSGGQGGSGSGSGGYPSGDPGGSSSGGGGNPSNSSSGSSKSGNSSSGSAGASSSSSSGKSSSQSSSPTGATHSGSSSSSSEPESDSIDCLYSFGNYNAVLHYKKSTQEIFTESTTCTNITTNAKPEDFSSGTCPPATLITDGGRSGTGVYCNIEVGYPGSSSPSQQQYGDSIQSYNSMYASRYSFKIPDIGGGTGFGSTANCKKIFGDAGYKIVNGLIRIIRILAPIVAILVSMITLIPAVTAKDEVKVKAATKKCVTIGIVLLVIEVIPYIVRLIGVILDFDLSCIG